MGFDTCTAVFLSGLVKMHSKIVVAMLLLILLGNIFIGNVATVVLNMYLWDEQCC